MSLSEKNLGKLKNFMKENNFNNNVPENTQKSHDLNNVYDPSKIFYSLIDNSDNLNETLELNQLLKKSEENFHSINSKETNYSNNLSTEDELYDEFNYLLDE